MTTTEKRPFKSYTTMSNSLINKLGCSDVYRTFVLLLTADKETGKTDTTIEQLAYFCDEKPANYLEVGKSESFNNKLRATKEVIITSTRGTSFKNGNGVTRNEYKFIKGETFRMISKELVDLDLSIKLKGYMIKLWSIACTNNCRIDHSSNEIYKLVGVSKATQKKYNASLIEAGLLTVDENGMILNVEAFNKIKKTIKPTKETLDTIERHKVILRSHIAFNNKKGANITELTREVIEKLKQDGMSATTAQFAYYFMTNFKGVTNINKLVKTLEYGKAKKETTKKVAPWAEFTF